MCEKSRKTSIGIYKFNSDCNREKAYYGNRSFPVEDRISIYLLRNQKDDMRKTAVVGTVIINQVKITINSGEITFKIMAVVTIMQKNIERTNIKL